MSRFTPDTPRLSQRDFCPPLSHVSYRNDGPNLPVGSLATVIEPGDFSSPWNTEVPLLATPSQSRPGAAALTAAGLTCPASAMAPPGTSTAAAAKMTMSSLVR